MKRGKALIILFLILLFSLSVFVTSNYHDDDDDPPGAPSPAADDYDDDAPPAAPSPVGIIQQQFTDPTGMKFEYALGTYFVNDDGECRQAGATYDIAKFGPMDTSEISEDGFITVNEPRSNTNLFVCMWSVLARPVLEENRGCLFFSSEKDHGQHLSAPYHRNDCMGWFIPEGHIQINYNSMTWNEHLPPEKDSWNDLAISKVYELDGNAGYNLNYGNINSVDDEPDNAVCIFEQYPFRSLDTSYVCVEKEEEHRWYACDEGVSFEKTKKFLWEKEIEELELDEKPIGYFCEYDGTGYVWDKRQVTCKDLDYSGENCDDYKFKQVCEEDVTDWFGDEEGKCCGDDGLEDIGDIESSGEGNEGNYVCLSEDDDFVRPSPPLDLCEEDFCWMEASSLPGKIFTIKKPDGIYDVASDGSNWRNCEENLDSFSSDQADHIIQANRLSCYLEGNRYVWAQCFVKGSEESVSPDSKNGIKNRFIGDGLFSLPLPEPSEGNSVEISIEEEYETFYGSLPVDFIGYDKIHVFFTFKELEDFPAKLDMGFYSGGFNLENLIFKKNIIGYATNNPVLEEGRTIHLEINIPNNLIGIDNLKFKTNGDNEIILNNVYFSIGEGDPKICSGEESNNQGVSSWLKDYGQDGDVSAENVCNALFDPFVIENEGKFPGNAWIKNSENDEDRCCGDQKNEYYAGKAIEG